MARFVCLSSIVACSALLHRAAWLLRQIEWDLAEFGQRCQKQETGPEFEENAEVLPAIHQTE